MTFPNLDRISGIHNYCDSWCERCAFTTRCAVYAVEVATQMFDGDHEAAAALVLSPRPPMTAEEERRREELFEAMNNSEPTDAEVAEYRRQEEARTERIEESPAITASVQAALLMDAWLDAHEEAGVQRDPHTTQALDVVRWDRHLIPVKLRRALRGLDEYTRDEDFEDDPVQNDWNGTAKVTLISIRRSIEAWNTLAEALSDPEAKAIAEELRELHRQVLRTFPDADRFIRPGFDQAAAQG